MLVSTAGNGEGVTDPDDVVVETLHDDSSDETWVQVAWRGDEYEDAWIYARDRDVVTLNEIE